MRRPNSPAGDQTETAHRTQNALRILWIYLSAVSLTLPLYLYLMIFQETSWQLLVLIGISLALILVTINGYRLVRKGRINLAMGSLISGMMVASAGVAAMVAGLGVVLGLSLALIALSVAAQTLPAKELNWVILIGFTGGIIAGIIELIGPATQLNVPAVQTFISTVALAVALIYGGFILWQFKSYPLATKFLIAFLIITLLPLSLMTVLNNYFNRETLTEEVGSRLNELAQLQALSVGNLLSSQIDLVQVLTSNETLQTKLAVVNNAYKGDATEIEAQLQALDQQWRAAPDNDAFIQKVMGDPGGEVLRKFRAQFVDHVELFVTDRYGALIATTNRTSDYYQADEEWWQGAFNEGAGGVYIGQPEFDESSNTYAINIAVPLIEPDTRAVLGILRTTYSMMALTNLINGLVVEKTVRGDIIFPGSQTLSGGRQESVPDYEVLRSQLKSGALTPYREITIEGAANLISQARVTAFTNEAAIAKLDWTLIVRQEKETVLASGNSRIRLSLLLVLVIAAGVAAIAVGAAQLLAGPITRLTQTALHIAAGNLNQAVEIESGDEIGQLASAFNTMTGRLQTTIGDLEMLVEERTKRLETVVDLSRRLAGILDLSDLLRQVVALTKEHFSYEQVHIYLVDDDGANLILAEGHSPINPIAKGQNVSIPLTSASSMVAGVARDKKVKRVEITQAAAEWGPDPVYSEARVRMAIPVMLGHEIVGVLDVQGIQVDHLTEDDIPTLQALCNYVAITVRNARTFTQTQEALYEAQRLQRMYTGSAWGQFIAVQPTTDYEYRQPNAAPLKQVTTPEAVTALMEGRTVDLRLGQENKRSVNGKANDADQHEEKPPTNGKPKGADEPDESAAAETELALATPLRLGSGIIGVLGIRDENLDRRWTKEEIALVEAVGEQMSLAIENARLFGETQHRAGREALTRQIADRIRNANSIEEILQTTVTELSKALGVSKTFIDLDTGMK
jgi:GAF domain-containing protein/HAMP domain-containing protein